MILCFFCAHPLIPNFFITKHTRLTLFIYLCFYRAWELMTMGSIVVLERGVGFDRTVSVTP